MGKRIDDDHRIRVSLVVTIPYGGLPNDGAEVGKRPNRFKYEHGVGNAVKDALDAAGIDTRIEHFGPADSSGSHKERDSEPQHSR